MKATGPAVIPAIMPATSPRSANQDDDIWIEFTPEDYLEMLGTLEMTSDLEMI